ncbi:hypothetical protein sr10980 [Sporisorium reilianum SRZ2]|uniref:Uncharacterized protein n=1 Tax=Sporisorium reilianum (strain SRZ2) TaxID=999809 RepID=E7A083_SPORE|nr:hypothetical protein sr10980 [Sporisorium reilianum SRZ2]
MDHFTPQEVSHLQRFFNHCDDDVVDDLTKIDEQTLGLFMRAILANVNVAAAPVAARFPAPRTLSAVIALLRGSLDCATTASDHSSASAPETRSANRADHTTQHSTATAAAAAAIAGTPSVRANISNPVEPQIDGSAPGGTASTSPPAVARPEAARVLLGAISLSSHDFVTPAQFRRLAGSFEEPRPLNMVVRITRNYGIIRHGPANPHRNVIVDIGDGRETKMFVASGSDLYDVDRNWNPFPAGELAVLYNVEGGFSGRKRFLTYNVDSSVYKFTIPTTWDEVLEWHERASAQMQN